MENNYYRTQNLYEASYLIAKGFKLGGKEQDDKKAIVLFKNKTEAEKESLNFYNESGLVVASKFVEAYRTLKDYVFQR